ncbi:hypothetical protein D8674_038335 [Pyrus ussuriensis x Pyrus communis]|uniref:Uncharacterized protein n=1 Tax=Pyrus ussuriensis x Pyrus communis TaxID=2448454 RepID=A0A5N5HBC2_9ROSA|nr:hypothetical protein D8674_038335 [Pyrus ussuriensis x Pyrus communis]
MEMKKKASDAVEKEQMKKLKLKNPYQEQMLELHKKAEPSIFKPKAGSVFPVKKRLVKRMMLDQIVKCFCSGSDSNSKNTISNHVYPSSP